MHKATLGYIFQSFLISLLLAGSYYIFCRFGFPHLQTNVVYTIIGILFFINAMFHCYFVNTIIHKNEAFVRRFLASTMLKLLIYLAVLLILIFTGQNLIKVILVSFLVFYIVFTAHEIYSIMDFLKKNSSQGARSK